MLPSDRPLHAFDAILRGLLGLLALALAALALRATAVVFHTPLTEDAFYALAVARNVAAGVGITIDGVQPTNGFQPLFTFLQAACYWLAGGEEALAARLVLALSWLVWVATTLLVAAVARDAAPGTGAECRRRGLVAAILYGGGFLTMMHHFNGLETGLVVCGYALLWRLHQLGVDQHRFGLPLVGGLLGLLVLTRIDAAVFVAVYCLALLWRRCRGEGGWRRQWPGALRAAVLVGAIAVLVSSPWWLFNILTFGSPMPTSGTAQQEWALDERRVRWGIWALGVAAMPSLWLGRLDEVFGDGIALSILRAVVASWLIVATVYAIRRAPPPLEEARTRATLSFAGLMAISVGVLTAYYVFSFIAFWFYYRYLFPVAILAAVGIAWVVTPLIERQSRAAAVIAVALCLPTLASALLAQTGRTLHVETVYWDQMALIDAHVAPDVPVAAGQAGTLGYFRAATVNVDGKVNREAIRHQDAMWVWLDQQGIRWFCDWRFYVEKYLGRDPSRHGWQKVATLGPWELWHRP
ncbi:MAG: hypothetical protein EAZ99_17135 [Alphaproteobacteria bacterium]|nr:MAG: hypothetical protein EAZ99_17135 [Alphaproteobacteria bacterium]